MDIIQPMSAVTDGIRGINATGVEYIEDMYAVRWTHVYSEANSRIERIYLW